MWFGTRRLVALGVGLWLIECFAIWSLGIEQLVAWIPDDSFFYLVIARHFPETLEFTFDGIRQTYGFQPLWQLCLLPLGFLQLGPEALLKTTLSICAGLHVASAFGLRRLVVRLGPRDVRFVSWGAWSVVVFWLANPGILRWFWGAKENGLYALLLIAVLLATLTVLEQPRIDTAWKRLGLLIGLTCLARVTFIPLSVFLLVGVFAMTFWRERKLADHVGLQVVRRMAMTLSFAGLVAIPWFGFARWHFGTAMPISGLVKFEQARRMASDHGMEWMSAQFIWHALRRLPAYFDQTLKLGSGPWGPIVVGLVAYSIVKWSWRHFYRPRVDSTSTDQKSSSNRATILAGICILAIANSAMTALALPSFLSYGQWYTVPEYIALALIASCAAQHLIVFTTDLRGSLGLGFAIVMSTIAWSTLRVEGVTFSMDTYGRRFDVHPNMVLMQAGLLIHQRAIDGGTAQGTTHIAAWDPGILAYFAEYPVISLDPLMSSLEYNEREKHDLSSFIERNGIEYVWGPAHEMGGGLVLNNAPPGTYEVILDVNPAANLGWNPNRVERYVLTKWPRAEPGPFRLP